MGGERRVAKKIIGGDQAEYGDIFSGEIVSEKVNDHLRPVENILKVQAEGGFTSPEPLSWLNIDDQDISEEQYLAILDRYGIDPTLETEPDEELIGVVSIIEERWKQAVEDCDQKEINKLKSENLDIRLAMAHVDKLLREANLL